MQSKRTSLQSLPQLDDAHEQPDLLGISHTALLQSGITVYTPICAPHPLEMKNPMRAQYNADPTKLVIGITVYNEEAHELQASLSAVVRNLRELQAVKTDAHTLRWNEILVLFIVDGAAKLSESAAAYLGSLAGSNNLLYNYARPRATSSAHDSGLQRSESENSGSAAPSSDGSTEDVVASNPAKQVPPGVAGSSGVQYDIRAVLDEHEEYHDAAGNPVSAQLFEWTSWLRIPVGGEAEVDDVEQGDDPSTRRDERQWADSVGTHARDRNDQLGSERLDSLGQASSDAAAEQQPGTASEMPEYLASVPVQLGLMVKQHNGGKTAACSWLLWAACRVIQPKYVLMLDVGTVPVPRALAHLFRRMEDSPDTAGMTGELSVRDMRLWKPLELMQWLEYRMAQVIGRASEDTFGFIAVLPGAFALYRYAAIEGEPLQAYFRQEETNEVANSAYLSNVYLAEDRMMTMRIISQHNARWKLKYEPLAAAYTDVPQTMNELMRQRRRWTNGALAANWHAMCQVPRILASGQSVWHKVKLMIEMLYILCTCALVILSPGTIYVACASMVNPFVYDIYPYLAGVDPNSYKIDELYLDAELGFHIVASTLLAILVIAGAWPGNFNRRVPIFAALGVIWGIVFLVAMIIMVYVWLADDPFAFSSGMAVAAFLGVMLLAGLSTNNLKAVVFGLPIYILTLPTFNVIIMAYSVLNCHDLSWGTKSATTLVDEHKPHTSATADSAAAADTTATSSAALSNADSPLSTRESDSPDMADGAAAGGASAQQVQVVTTEAAMPSTPIPGRMLPGSKNVPRLPIEERRKRYTRFRNIVFTILLVGNALVVLSTWLGYGRDLLLPVALVFVMFMLLFVIVGMAVFLIRRKVASLYRRVARPPLAKKDETQISNCAYKTDPHTNKLRHATKPTNFFGNDWIWAVQHGKMNPDLVKQEIGHHPRAHAVAAAELYNLKHPATFAKAVLGECPRPVDDAHQQLVYEFQHQSGVVMPERIGRRRTTMAEGVLMHYGIPSTAGISHFDAAASQSFASAQ